MGNESFLRGSGGQPVFDNIQDAIEDLRDASEVFVRRFSRGELKRAGEVSLRAFECFDHIVGELMRNRDDRNRLQMYLGTPFQQKMQAITASIIEPASFAEQAAIAAAGPGRGRLPAGRTATPLSLERTLNKIKHRHTTNLNFRIDAGRHVMLVCPIKPDGIVEFDVINFCDLCVSASSAL